MSSDGRHNPDTPGPGSVLLHYEIEEEIGRGGMGRVLKAHDRKLDRKVALKILPPEFVSDPDRLQRFQREARTLAALNHPNIVTIFGVEEFEDHHFLVMELVEGGTLKEAIRTGGMSLEAFLDASVCLADSLYAAAEQGITHRDLKPDNIMVSDSGRMKILDFGLAKATPEDTIKTSDSDQDELTQKGMIMGTMPYMSPEQVQGRTVDHRSDIFSMGIVFYEMLTGSRPFQGETAAQLISSILRDTPNPVVRLRSGTPPHLDRIVRKCLEKRPEKRFQTALDVRDHLRTLQREVEIERVLASDDARTVQSANRRPKPARRSPPAEALLHTRWGLVGVLALVFLTNYVETALEELVKLQTGFGINLGHQLARAAHWLEGSYRFENHDVAGWLAVYGYSSSYFFFFPALAVLIAVVIARRRTLSAFRVLCLAVATDYVISLPFFMFFPVVERWAYPDSGAILLSDLWSSRLIEAFRPISGLDNCFPSFHVSLTMVLVLVCYRFRLRFRHAIPAVGLTIIFSTWVLGIHWIADMVAGAAVAVVSVAVAVHLDRMLGARGPEASRG